MGKSDNASEFLDLYRRLEGLEGSRGASVSIMTFRKNTVL